MIDWKRRDSKLNMNWHLNLHYNGQIAVELPMESKEADEEHHNSKKSGSGVLLEVFRHGFSTNFLSNMSICFKFYSSSVISFIFWPAPTDRSLVALLDVHL